MKEFFSKVGFNVFTLCRIEPGFVPLCSSIPLVVQRFFAGVADLVGEMAAFVHSIYVISFVEQNQKIQK